MEHRSRTDLVLDDPGRQVMGSGDLSVDQYGVHHLIMSGSLHQLMPPYQSGQEVTIFHTGGGNITCVADCITPSIDATGGATGSVFTTPTFTFAALGLALLKSVESAPGVYSWFLVANKGVTVA